MGSEMCIRDSCIKQQAELMKIIEVQKQVRKEMDEKPEEPKDDSKDKEKEDKKKENEKKENEKKENEKPDDTPTPEGNA